MSNGAASPLILHWDDGFGDLYLADHWTLKSASGSEIHLRPAPEEAYRLAQTFHMAGDELLALLTGAVNEGFGFDWSKQTVEVALGTFIRAYTESMGVRAYIMDHAVRTTPPNAQLISKANSVDWITPRSSKHYQTVARLSLLFNRQLFTALTGGLRPGVPLVDSIGEPKQSGPLVALKRSGRVGMPECRAHHACPHVHCAANLFPRVHGLLLWIGTGGSVRSIPAIKDEVSATKVDRSLRSALFGFSVAEGLLDQLWRNLEVLLPVSLFEALPEVVDRARRGPTPRAYVGPVPTTDADHVRLAVYAERGVPIYLAQHGGYYGETVPKASEFHERSISREFLTWGWSDGHQCRPLPSPRMSYTVRRLRHGRLRPRVGTSSWRFLWVTQDQWRFDYRLPPISIGIGRYQKSTDAFRKGLEAETAQSVAIRFRPVKYAHASEDAEQPQRIEIGGFSVTPSGASIDELLARAEVVVLDSAFTTTFLECLSRDIPVLLFDPEGLPYVRSSVRPAYAALEEAGIVHVDPRRAAETLNAMRDNVGSWWRKPARQKAVELARRTLARTGPSYFIQWASFIRAIREEGAAELGSTGDLI